MKKDSLMQQLLVLLIICGGVYLGFCYLLPLFFPFLLAYILMRMLLPIMEYLHNVCNWPRLLANYGVTAAFFFLIIFAVVLLAGQITTQLRLFLLNFPVYQQLLSAAFNKQSTHLCNCIDYYLHLDSGTTLIFFNQQTDALKQQGMDLLSSHTGETIVNFFISSFQFIAVILIIAISMIILAKEMETLNEKYRQNRYYSSIHTILSGLKKSGLTYLKTELIILLLNAAVCSFGLFLIQNPYFFILGIGISVFDAFPILGSGLILLPWCIYELFSKNYYYAAILATTYLVTLFIREYLEAKLLGNGMGINPFFTIASIFIGTKLFGATGIFLGPLALVLIRALLAEFHKEQSYSSS